MDGMWFLLRFGVKLAAGGPPGGGKGKDADERTNAALLAQWTDRRTRRCITVGCKFFVPHRHWRLRRAHGLLEPRSLLPASIESSFRTPAIWRGQHGHACALDHGAAHRSNTRCAEGRTAAYLLYSTDRLPRRARTLVFSRGVLPSRPLNLWDTGPTRHSRFSRLRAIFDSAGFQSRDPGQVENLRNLR